MRLRAKLSGALLAILALLVLAAWWAAGGLLARPLAPGGDRLVLDRGGELLANLKHPRLRKGPDLGPGQTPPLLKAALLAAEDRRFFWHPGVDPLSLGRALFQNLQAGRVVSGGSTITMQLVRLLDPAPRNLGAKLKEMFLALGLETRLAKEEIIRRYLNLAPFGGPLRGVSAASRELLGKSPARLTPAEAALLLSLPKNPSRLLRPARRQELLKRRDCILRAMARGGALSPASRDRALASALPALAPAQPLLAPHFALAAARRSLAGTQGLIHTTLDANLQRMVQKIALEKTAGLEKLGIRQAAVLVLDNQSMAALAWLGSLDFNSPAGGQVDGVLARRQPGSALKPMIYGLALAQGKTLADQIADEPMGLLAAKGVFRPLDYDCRHRGSVSLRIALASSLNLPALRLTGQLGPERVLAGLRKFGLRLPLPAEHYGLGLALGNGESSLLELCTAYAALASGGVYRPVRLLAGSQNKPGRQALDPYSCRLVADALSDDQARELGFGRHSFLELPFPAAVKTGTSQRHRDNWCVGFTSQYTVGVWVGNFEGKPMRGVSGLTGAGPLWRAVMLHLHHSSPGRLPPWPPGMERKQVCLSRSAQGDCLSKGEEIFAPDKKTVAASPPPVRTLGPEILAPLDGAVYALDPDLPAELQYLPAKARMRGSLAQTSRPCWLLDGEPLAGGKASLEPRLPLRPGKHLVELSLLHQGRRLTAKAGFVVLP